MNWIASIHSYDVCGLALKTHSTETLVPEPKSLAWSCDVEMNVVGILFIYRILSSYRYRALRSALVDLLPRHQRFGKLERAILHSFGIQATISSEVNVLEENAKH